MTKNFAASLLLFFVVLCIGCARSSQNSNGNTSGTSSSNAGKSQPANPDSKVNTSAGQTESKGSQKTANDRQAQRKITPEEAAERNLVALDPDTGYYYTHSVGCYDWIKVAMKENVRWAESVDDAGYQGYRQAPNCDE